jgi:hypothetical protein
MTDKNRQKGNESVGEKSDGLARDIDAREALQRKYGTLGTVEDAAAFIERKAEAHASDFGYGVGGTLCFGRQEEMDHYATLTELAEELRMLARPAPESSTLFGMSVIVDPKIAPDTFEIRSAPDALGAAKGVELSDAEIRSVVTDAIGFDWNDIDSEGLQTVNSDDLMLVCRAILAKAKGDQA